MSAAPPEIALIAGPNGSGKTTFYDRFLKDAFPIFVNADRIREQSSTSGKKLSDIQAANLAESERQRLVASRVSFATETVFSRQEHWLGFIERARANDYVVALHFICLEAPELNFARVISRVKKGGHSVPAERIEKRWHRSLNTAVLSIRLVDELWLYDNSVSNREQRLLGLFSHGEVTFEAADRPLWSDRFFGTKAKS